MKEVIILEEPLNSEIDDISMFLKEYQDIQRFKRELEIREKIYKTYLLKNLPKNKDNAYNDGKYVAYVTETTTNRMDSDWIKEYFKSNLIEVPLKETASQRLNVRIVK